MSADAEAEKLHTAILAALGELPARVPSLLSLTVAGSFAAARNLEGISDIDTIAIVKDLTPAIADELHHHARALLEPLLAASGYALRINWSLGPLKFNDARTAVLHLMTYTAEAHRQHVINSPFTCLDWQRAENSWGRTLAGVYPVFALQPHHFLSARRGARDYARDLLSNEVSYREFVIEAGQCREAPRAKPMTTRDRHEFAYHIMRFMMANFLKLIRRANAVPAGTELAAAYFAEFPHGAAQFQPFYAELSSRKRALEFDPPLANLLDTTLAFLDAFEQQFRHAFETDAVRHLWTRHLPTCLNAARGDATIFQGQHTDEPILDPDPAVLEPLHAAVAQWKPTCGWSSPSQRARATLQLASPQPPRHADPRLHEINYGACEGQTVAQARAAHPGLFAAWSRGEDPRFPGGENNADVQARLQSFIAEHIIPAVAPACIVTHNVVLRCLIGAHMRVPAADWWRLNISHAQPLGLIVSRRYGCFIDLDPAPEGAIEASIFKNFFMAGS